MCGFKFKTFCIDRGVGYTIPTTILCYNLMGIIVNYSVGAAQMVFNSFLRVLLKVL
jgi:hypothetical protein